MKIKIIATKGLFQYNINISATASLNKTATSTFLTFSQITRNLRTPSIEDI